MNKHIASSRTHFAPASPAATGHLTSRGCYLACGWPPRRTQAYLLQSWSTGHPWSCLASYQASQSHRQWSSKRRSEQHHLTWPGGPQVFHSHPTSIPATLADSSFMYDHCFGAKPQPSHAYSGSFTVISRFSKYFVLDMGDRQE